MSHLTSRFPVDPDRDHDDIADADGHDHDHDDNDADAEKEDVYEDFYPSPWPQTSLGSTHAPPKIIKIKVAFSSSVFNKHNHAPPKMIKTIIVSSSSFFNKHNCLQHLIQCLSKSQIK